MEKTEDEKINDWPEFGDERYPEQLVDLIIDGLIIGQKK